jgi:hypothetical protein
MDKGVAHNPGPGEYLRASRRFYETGNTTHMLPDGLFMAKRFDQKLFSR